MRRDNPIRHFRHASVLTLLLLSLVACNNSNQEKPGASPTKEHASNPTDTPLNESAASIEQNQIEQNQEIVGDDQEQKPIEKQDAAISSQGMEEQQSDSANSLIQDLGFSGVAEPSAPEPQEQADNYCINDAMVEEYSSDSACKKISNRLASVEFPQCQSAQLKPSGCKSVEDFPILLSEFAPIEGKKAQGRILVVGGIHGDELTSVSVTFRWIDKLRKYHSGLFHWHVIPMMNPDGVLKREASRTNSNGVDLNRNMPSDDWHDTAIKYWQDKTSKNPRRNPGLEPASEPESQWLIDEINHFKPDAIISVHAPYGVVDFDSLLLNTAPKSLGKLHLNLLGTFPGSLGNYAGMNRNIPVITLELPHAWEMPSEKETTKIWEDIVGWLKKNVNAQRAAESTATTQE